MAVLLLQPGDVAQGQQAQAGHQHPLPTGGPALLGPEGVTGQLRLLPPKRLTNLLGSTVISGVIGPRPFLASDPEFASPYLLFYLCWVIQYFRLAYPLYLKKKKKGRVGENRKYQGCYEARNLKIASIKSSRLDCGFSLS